MDGAGRFVDPIVREGADLRGRDQHIAEQRAHRLAQAAALIRVGVPNQTAAADDFDVGAGFMQDRRGFAGALAAADHGHALAFVAFGVGVFAGMADELARQPVELRRPVFVAEQALRHHHAFGEEGIAAIEHETETAIERLNALHDAAVDIGRNVFLEPDAVVDKILDRQKLGHFHAGFAVIFVEREPAARLADMGGNPRRAQQHAFGHVIAPERQRLTEHADRHVGGAQMRGDGEPVRAGANDSDVATVARTERSDGNIHWKVLDIRLQPKPGNLAALYYQFANSVE